ncbi:MAG TPA: hypothetical protein PKW90_12495 [Myxococcota bacterium]|nr:hypothetical protein [Myxococcota bacterium]
MKEVDVVIDLADRDVVLGRLIAGELEVDQVIVEGALRTTGAATGPAGSGPRLPRRPLFNRDVR